MSIITFHIVINVPLLVVIIIYILFDHFVHLIINHTLMSHFLFTCNLIIKNLMTLHNSLSVRNHSSMCFTLVELTYWLTIWTYFTFTFVNRFLEPIKIRVSCINSHRSVHQIRLHFIHDSVYIVEFFSEKRLIS